MICDWFGDRTQLVFRPGLTGRCLQPTQLPSHYFERPEGLEPTTLALEVPISSIELQAHSRLYWSRTNILSFVATCPSIERTARIIFAYMQTL